MVVRFPTFCSACATESGTHPLDIEVLFNGHLKTLHEVVQNQIQKVPKAKIAYHRMEDSPDPKRVGNFKLTRSHQVWFIPQTSGANVEEPQEDEAQPSSAQGNAAKLVPNHVWKSHATKIIYSVKWGVSGLMPIRPQVVLIRDVDLSPARCCELF